MINEETLILYYYRDGLDEAGILRIEQALKSDRLLAQRYQQLSSELDAVAGLEETSAPEHMVHQWHSALDAEAQLESQRQTTNRPGFRFLQWGGALAFMLVLGISIGLFLNNPAEESAPGMGVVPASVFSPGAFQRGLRVHLSSSQDEIMQLSERPADERSALLLQIVAQNRLFEQAAENNDAKDIARLMRAFEPILMQLASDDLSSQDEEQLRRQLSFELKAMLTKMQTGSSDESQSI